MARDGSVWTQTMFPYSFWERYLEVFEKVKVVARADNIAEAPFSYHRVDGEGVCFHPLPYYIGPYEFASKFLKFRKAVFRAYETDSALIFRASSIIPEILSGRIEKNRHPFGVEVVGDPYDVFAPGAVKHPLRGFFRLWSPYRLRKLCSHASAVAYVTERALQQRYPPNPGAFATYYSDVELPESAFRRKPRKYPKILEQIKLITVGSLEQLYKGTDILIEAIAICRGNGLNLILNIIGDGKYKNQLQTKVKNLGLENVVLFHGQLPAGESVRRHLEDADIFVLPSRTEGLPRAMVEAMARALPCVGTSVGGIPELLIPSDTVPPRDPQSLAAKLLEVATKSERLETMSIRNLKKARNYQDEILRKRRITFYKYIMEKTQDWLRLT